MSLEIVNILDERFQIHTHGPFVDYNNIYYWEFFRQYYKRIYDLPSRYYSPAADKNHDGLISVREQYDAFWGLVVNSDDWGDAYSAPRRARLGISIVF